MLFEGVGVTWKKLTETDLLIMCGFWPCKISKIMEKDWFLNPPKEYLIGHPMKCNNTTGWGFWQYPNDGKLVEVLIHFSYSYLAHLR